MFHYDESVNLRTFFRPQLLGVVNKVFKRNYVKQSTIDSFFNIRVHLIDTWSFSFASQIISMLLMICVGFLGLIFPPEYIIAMAILPVILVSRCLFNNVLAHGMLLAVAISLMTTNTLVLWAIALFVIIRILIDAPYIMQLKRWSKLHERISVVYVHGYNHPLEDSKYFRECVGKLVMEEVPHKYLIESYTFGNEISKNDRYTREEVTDFLKNIIQECLYDADIG